MANELKLGGKKNPDQMLKYSLMFRLLRERGFISNDTRFLLLFIGDKEISEPWDELLQAEIEHCQRSSKSTAKKALYPDRMSLASEVQYASTTWSEMRQFNEEYAQMLALPDQQVEDKLLRGFNEALSVKAFF